MVSECLSGGQWEAERVVWNWILGVGEAHSEGAKDFEILFAREHSTIGVGSRVHGTYGETTSAIVVKDLI